MSDQANLLVLVRSYQHKNPDTDIYFSLSTALKLMRDLPAEDVFVMSFGKPANLPKKVIHKNIPVKVGAFVSFQPFKLDSVLVSARDGAVLDPFNAQKDAELGIVSTTSNAHALLESKPQLIIRAAALIAETGFIPSNDLLEASEIHSVRLLSSEGDSVWKEMKRLLRAPKPSDGINFLHRCGALAQILPELVACYGVSQNDKYHKYSVYEHCLLACDSCSPQDIRIRFAALIHDVGKPVTKGENENGITFHKHEVESRKMAIDIVNRLRINRHDSNFIVLLVGYHMYQYDRAWKNATVRRFIKNVGLTKEYLGRLGEFPLFKLRHADRQGRGLEPMTQKQSDFEARIEEALRNESQVTDD